MTEKFRWIPTEEKNHSQSGVYKCTLNDGKVHEVFGSLEEN